MAKKSSKNTRPQEPLREQQTPKQLGSPQPFSPPCPSETLASTRLVFSKPLSFTADAKFLAELAGRFGHETSNPLTSIISLSTILERFLEPGQDSQEKTKEYARAIGNEAWKLSKLNEHLVLFFGNRLGQPTTVDLRQMIKRALDRLRLQNLDRLRLQNIELADEVIVRCHGEAGSIDETAPIAYVDADLVFTTLLELLSNALEASKLCSTSESTPAPVHVTISRHDDTTSVEIANSFGGDLPDLNQLAQPLVSFFDSRRRLGLGLPLCINIVCRSRGLFELELKRHTSSHLHSFCVRLHLPSTKDAFVSEPSSPSHSSLPKNSDSPIATTLSAVDLVVIDDQPHILSAIEKIARLHYGKSARFNFHGYSGKEALQVFSSLPDTAVLLCDINLNAHDNDSLSGKQIYQILQQQRPELCSRFAFITGDPEMVKSLKMRYLLKPFDAESLLKLLEQLLSSC